MSQISRRYLSPKVEQQIFTTFLDSFTSLGSPQNAQDFLSDLLSHTEQVMLGKRLAIAYMFQKGYTQRTIADTLKVSLATVNKVAMMVKMSRGYKNIIDHMLKKEAIVSFFNELEEKIDKILPPKGANWSMHYAQARKERLTKKKAF